MHKHLLSTTRLMLSWTLGSEETEMNSHPFQYNFCLLSADRERPFGHYQSAVLTLFPPSSMCPPLTMALALYNTA